MPQTKSDSSRSIIPHGLHPVVGLDPRSLGAFRICLGLCVLFTIGSFGRDFGSIYGADGVLPLETFIKALTPARAYLLLPFTLAPEAIEWLLPSTLGLCGVLLVLGVGTRAASLVAWLGFYCLSIRNPVIMNYGDELLARLLFWSMFLPLDRSYSVKALMQPSRRIEITPVIGVATAGLLLQIAVIYFIGGAGKTGPDWTVDGSALSYVMGQQYWATPYSAWILNFPQFATLGSLLTPWAELGIFVILLSPIATQPLRLVAVAMIYAFHITLIVTMTLGVAPFVSLAAALAVLPPLFWDRGQVKQLPADDTYEEDSIRVKRPGRLLEVLLLVPLFMIPVFASVGAQVHLVPQPIKGIGIWLRQIQPFEVFSPSVMHHDGWFSAPGLLSDGQHIDLNRNGAPYTASPPDSVPWAGDSYRWGIFNEQVVRRADTIPTNYVLWMCRQWNDEHPTQRVLSVDLEWNMIDRTIGAQDHSPHVMKLVQSNCP